MPSVWRVASGAAPGIPRTTTSSSWCEAPGSTRRRRELERIMARTTSDARKALDHAIAELRDLPYSFWREAVTDQSSFTK